MAITDAHDVIDGGELTDPALVDRREQLGEQLVKFHDIQPDIETITGQENKGAD